jgi:hypothetical protein
MTQFARPTPAAADYDSTIIGALELSEKKWVLAVQLPGVKRHSRHVVEARGDELAAFVERANATIMIFLIRLPGCPRRAWNQLDKALSGCQRN